MKKNHLKQIQILYLCNINQKTHLSHNSRFVFHVYISISYRNALIVFSTCVVTPLRKLSFECWGSWPMSLQDCFKKSLKNHGSWERFRRTGRQQRHSCFQEGQKEKAADIVYFDFSKAFSTVSHNICIDKLMKFGQHKQTVRWIEDWLNCWDQRIAAWSPAGG